eukprot:TRINITY_DN8545_c0_g1_i1.p1 TRINITY_DN8545_c0_g1~~TRINITY_DN8545_c0_g1_i1.p1  ORF type:complete len:169 (+),score=45.49 TRINITY_DN8545_c0_g1_i1:64-570(+)
MRRVSRVLLSVSTRRFGAQRLPRRTWGYQRHYAGATKIIDGLKYTKSHEWIKVDGNIGTIGISDYAQSAMGDIVYVDLPEVGEEFDQGVTYGAIDSQKATEDIFCPVAGEVVEVNEQLAEEAHAALVNTDPYGEGWMIKINIKEPAQLDGLLDAAAYKEHEKEEAENH